MKQWQTDLMALEEDWDSYGGHTPTPTAITTAEKVIKEFGYPIRISPIPSGGVHLSYYKGTRHEVNVDITPSGRLDLFTIRRTFEEREDVTMEEIREVL